MLLATASGFSEARAEKVFFAVHRAILLALPVRHMNSKNVLQSGSYVNNAGIHSELFDPSGSALF